MQEINTYQPSGRIGVRAMAVNALVGLPVAAGLGYALAWAQSHADGWLASSICVFLATVVVSVLFGIVAEQSHSRNVRANTVAAVALLACLFAVRWWRAEAMPDEALVSLIFSAPVDAWAASLTGAVLEALVVSSLALVMYCNQARTPYSEASRCWAQKGMEGELWAGSASADQVRANLQQHGLHALLAMWPAGELGAPVAALWRTVVVIGHRVASDEHARWLTIKVRTHERNEEGKIRSRGEDVVEHWAVTADDYLAVQQLLEKAGPPAAEATAQGADTAADESASAPATPTVLQPAVTALEAEQYAACYTLAQAHCHHPDPQTQADAWRLCALAKSRMGDWPVAFDAYHHLHALEPSAFNALQLATSSVMAGELARGEAWFARALELSNEQSEMPPARMRTAYLSALEQAGEFDAVLPHLDWLAQGYMAMGLTDDHHVWMRGFPFFSEFLGKSRQLLAHVLSETELRAWYERMIDQLDERGREMLQQHLATVAAR